VDLKERLERDRGVLTRLGIDAAKTETGGVELRLRVTADMLNAGQACHGGLLFALADTACAYALAEAGVSPVTVDANMTFLRAAKLHDEVVAAAEVAHAGRRFGHCEVQLVAAGQVVALYRASCANV
jgi:phenylacetic acid degradation protein PaaD